MVYDVTIYRKNLPRDSSYDSFIDLYNDDKEFYNLYFQEPRFLTNEKIYRDIFTLGHRRFTENLAYNYIKNTEMKRNLYNAHIEYVNNLSELEKKLLKWYTYQGDRIMNNYLRNKFKTNDFINIYHSIVDTYEDYLPQELRNKRDNLNDRDVIDSIFRIVKYSIDTINNIINNAPKNKDYFVVYQYSQTQRRTDNDEYWENVGFYSTTLIDSTDIPPVQNAKCKTYIIVPPESNFLALAGISKYPEEYEILFPSSNCFKVLQPFTEYQIPILSIRHSTQNEYYKRIILYEKQGICNT